VKQRPAGQQCGFYEIECSPNGIPCDTKVAIQRKWLWRNDQLIMTGATQSVDLELEYIAYLPDIVNNSPAVATPWYQQQVPVTRCATALSWYLAAEVANARGDVDAAALAANGAEATKQIVNRQYRSRQRVNQRRKSYRQLANGNCYY
jgi:hypothetical protein